MSIKSYSGSLTINNAISDEEMSEVIFLVNSRMSELFQKISVEQVGNTISINGEDIRSEDLAIFEVAGPTSPFSLAMRPLSIKSAQGEFALNFEGSDTLITDACVLQSTSSMKFDPDNFLNTTFNIKHSRDGVAVIDETDVPIGDFERCFYIGKRSAELMGMPLEYSTYEEAIEGEGAKLAASIEAQNSTIH